MRDNRQTWVRAGRSKGQTHPPHREYRSGKCRFRAHHRRWADTFLSEINIDIDQAVEVDSVLFWKKIKC